MNSLPTATALVLRDRTNSDPLQVLTVAIDDLVATGVWTASRRRRRPWAPRGVFVLTPAADTPPPAGLVEPGRTTDALLRAAALALDPPLTAPALGGWLAIARPAAPAALVHTTVDDLVTRGLLLRTLTALKPTPAGGAALASTTIPLTARPTARDKRHRTTGLRTLSPLGRQLVTAATTTKTGAHGFPAGSIGADIDAPGQSNGDNVQAAIRTGTGTL